jgi:hypothetical protein
VEGGSKEGRKGTCVLTSLAQKWEGIYMLLPLPKRGNSFIAKRGNNYSVTR